MSTPVDEIALEICRFIRENIVANGADFTESSSLANLGIDSFSIVEIILFLERRFGRPLPLEMLNAENIQSVKSLSDKYASVLDQ